MKKQNKKEQKYQNDCHELHSALIDTLDKFTQPRLDEVAREDVIPVVLVSIMASHFAYFKYHQPKDILTFLNYIKSELVTECTKDTEELGMVNDIDYLSQFSA